ncbi:hypothetical protein AVEN_232398-1 [Araneus ventricosus]|uniref:Tc1-like transposase DDE domain-containing protein n=1 Tax=Araneus ventricosus TaxID=182803 RepID=A0A4Y2CUA9_ARAVE|nr:hypothetical protein AVEN_232398-1 [Araneus ventricosus]
MFNLAVGWRWPSGNMSVLKPEGCRLDTLSKHYGLIWSAAVGLPAERCHHLQSVCLQDVVSVDETDEKSGWSVLQYPPYSPDLAPSDFHLTTTMRMR